MSAGVGHGERSPARARRQRRRPSSGEFAWVALLPWAAITAVALLLVGPALGRALFPVGDDPLWPVTWWVAQGQPEPAEYGRYAIAALSPVALSALIAVGTRRAPPLHPRAIVAIALTAQVGVAGLVAVAVLGQRGVLDAGQELLPIPTNGALLSAAALAALPLLALRHPGVRALAARLARESRARRAAGLAIAAACAALWALDAITTDRLAEDAGQLNWALNDAFAVLNGRTTLVDYHVLYAKLLPYPAALALSTFGTTGLVFSLTMAALCAAASIAVYATFRRVVHGSLLALVLFVPFVATSDLGHTMAVPATWPMRYGGAYLLAWLVARHVDGSRPRHAWPLFLVGGLAAIDNQDFGTAALVATFVALLCARPPRSAAAVRRLVLNVAGGLGAAIAAVSALTLVRAGALPDPALLSEWSRIFTRLGWFSLAMPRTGFYIALYVTFAAAVVTAGVRLARRDDDVLLTCLLAWSGTFGLLAGVYYVGRSDDLKLLAMLSAWAFAIALLTVATARALTARKWRAPTLADVLVLFGFGLAIWSITRLITPQDQIARIAAATPPLTYRASAERFVRERTRPNETVAITLPESFRIAYDLGLRNVAPYVMENAIVTRSQLQALIDTLRREHVRSLFVPEDDAVVAGEGQTPPEHFAEFGAAGYRVTDRQAGFIELERSAVPPG